MSEPHKALIRGRQGRPPVVGLALGSGAARGWAHVGVLKALQRESIEPDVICGCSIGALVGAAYASGKIDSFAEWIEGLDWQRVVAMLDISLRGGLIRGDRVVQYCAQHFFVDDMAELPLPFACVATELETGREIWLRDGSLSDAVRASIALPGLFSPMAKDGRLLVDGGLVNPVPVSLCRALGADVVLAVDLGSGIVGRRLRRPPIPVSNGASWPQRLLNAMRFRANGDGEEDIDGEGKDCGDIPLADIVPSWADVVISSINVMQMRIARSRLAGEPADVLILPRVAQLGMMEFDCAAAAISEGEAAVRRALPYLRDVLGIDHDD